MRRFLEIAVVVVIAVVFTRVFVAEAYIVPTGSMAPALAGNHKACNCPCCGYPIMVGHQGRNPLEGGPEEEREADAHYRQACCPNCGWEQLNLEQVAECPGDRLLVHKHLFEFRDPRRWEMVVFRNPHVERNSLADTYIKRVVGLPEERVLLRDGDVYINGAIARKTLAEFREMRLPVFDNDYLPRDRSKQPRWYGWGHETRWQPEDDGRVFVRCKSAASIDGRERSETWDWLCYRHLVREREDGKTVWKPSEVRDVAGYNGAPVADRLVHDFLLEADAQCRGVGWLAIALTDGFDDLLMEIPIGQNGTASLRHAASRHRPAAKLAPALASLPCHIATDQNIHIEAGLVDRRVLVAINGTEVFGNVDLPSLLDKGGRQLVSEPLALGGRGPVSVAVYSLDAKVSHLRLYRDIHYCERNGKIAYPNAVTQAVDLGPGEYFMLGDNSTNSYDSRCWKSPAIRADYLVGKAFLVHMPTRLLEWRQFGEKRALAVPDWSRMKLLR